MLVFMVIYMYVKIKKLCVISNFELRAFDFKNVKLQQTQFNRNQMDIKLKNIYY